MKYTIELTNKQKAQMDCIIEIVHRYIGFNPKLEPIKATNVEDTNEYQIGYKVGFEDGENRQGYYDNGYNEALKDADHAMDVLKSMTGDECAEWFKDCVGVDEVVCGFTVQRIVEITKAYEEKKKAEDEIKVGDEVFITGLKDQETIGVITMLANNNYTVICLINGSEMARVTKNDIKLTGRHFDEVSQLFDKLRGEDSE